MPYKKLWIALGIVMLVSFSFLGSVGYKAIRSGGVRGHILVGRRPANPYDTP